MVKLSIIVAFFIALVVSYPIQRVKYSVQNLNGTLSISIGNITPMQLKVLDDDEHY